MIKALCPLCATRHTSTEFCPALGGVLGEGAAKRLATGPENQSDRKVRGSTPPPSATKVKKSSTAVLKETQSGVSLDSSTERAAGSMLGSTPSLGASGASSGNQAPPVDFQTGTVKEPVNSFSEAKRAMTQAERSAKHYEANREKRKEANKFRMRKARMK